MYKSIPFTAYHPAHHLSCFQYKYNIIMTMYMITELISNYLVISREPYVVLVLILLSCLWWTTILLKRRDLLHDDVRGIVSDDLVEVAGGVGERVGAREDVAEDPDVFAFVFGLLELADHPGEVARVIGAGGVDVVKEIGPVPVFFPLISGVGAQLCKLGRTTNFDIRDSELYETYLESYNHGLDHKFQEME
jgi:hypothetical protein